jgi:phage gpG-like protein
MASDGFESGITFDLKTLNWGDVLSELFDETAIRDALLETLDEMENMIQDHFEDKSPGWKALAASTVKNRVRLNFAPGPILYMSGTLKDNVAANRDVEINGTEISGAVFPAEATAPYSDVPITEYAEALNEVRPFFDFTDDEEEKIFDILEEKIAEKLGFI